MLVIAKGDNNLQTELVETLTFLATSVQETKLRSSLIIKPVSLRVFLWYLKIIGLS